MGNLAILIVLFSLLSGCVIAHPLKTLSGRPEVFLPNATPIAIKNHIVAGMVFLFEDMLTNYGSTFERTTPLNGSNFKNQQGYLESMKTAWISQK